MIEITADTKEKRLPRQLLQAVLEDALAAHLPRGKKPGKTMVALRLLDGAEIAKLNLQFHHREGETDVLAFPIEEVDEEGVYLLGDVAVNAALAAREAKKRGIPMREELALYALHGTLHLLGFRDHSARERTAMRKAEREALAKHDIVPNWDEAKD